MLNCLLQSAAGQQQQLLILAERASAPQLQAALALRASEWSRNLDELHELVIEAAGAPAEGPGPQSAAEFGAAPLVGARRAPDLGLLDECAEAERRAASTYRQALDSQPCTARIRAVLTRQLDGMQRAIEGFERLAAG